jgi:autotransporter-associated beta strand protein
MSAWLVPAAAMALCCLSMKKPALLFKYEKAGVSVTVDAADDVVIAGDVTGDDVIIRNNNSNAADTVDVGGNTITGSEILGNIETENGLEKDGSGRLVVQGENIDYTAETTISAGELLIEDDSPDLKTSGFNGGSGATGGRVVIQSTENEDDFTGNFSTSGLTFGSKLTGVRIGKTAGDNDIADRDSQITVASAIDIATGAVEIFGGSIDLNANLGSDATSGSGIDLQANEVVQAAGLSVSTQGADVNYTVHASNDTYAMRIGESTSGATTTIDAAGGDITLSSTAKSGQNVRRAIQLINADLSTTGSGEIDVTGDATDSGITSSNAWGIQIYGSQLETDSGDITLTGTGGKDSRDSRGIVAQNTDLKLLSDSGAITLIDTDATDGGSDGNRDYKGLWLAPDSDGSIVLGADGSDVSMATGDITLQADTLQANDHTVSAVGSGNLVVESSGTGFLGETSTINIDATGDNFSSITLGKSGNTGELTSNAELTADGTFTAYGPLTLNDSITTSGTQTYNGDVTIAGSTVTLSSLGSDSTGGAMTFTGNIDGAQANANDLVLHSGNKNIGVTGGVGSTVALGSLKLGGTVLTETQETQVYNKTFGDQSSQDTYTVLNAGKYRLEAYGAEGGNGDSADPGKGAIIKGTFAFAKDEALSIIIGEQPTAQGEGSGGGGGTFIWRSVSGAPQPLIIAGGGGGVGDGDHGVDAQTGTSGADARGSDTATVGGAGGIDGNGGHGGDPQTNSAGAAGGGGGFREDGSAGSVQSAFWGEAGNGGQAALNGGAGASSTTTSGGGDSGGFGGGGGEGDGYQESSQNDAEGGGGGGGYSGGGGGNGSDDNGGGGGGSFIYVDATDAATSDGSFVTTGSEPDATYSGDVANLDEYHSGDGKVLITFFEQVPVGGGNQTGNITIGGGVNATELNTSNTDFDLALASDATKAGSVNIGSDTTLNNTGTVQIGGGDYGQNAQISGKLDTTAASKTTLGASVTTTGTQTYDQVELMRDVVLKTTDSTVDINQTVDSAGQDSDGNDKSHSLTVQTGSGDINFDQAIGGTQALNNIILDSTGAVTFDGAVTAASLRSQGSATVAINGGSIDTTSGDQTYGGDITLGAGTTLTAANLTAEGIALTDYDLTVDLTGNNSEIAGNITESASAGNTFTQEGSGTLTLSGDNGYTGATAIDGGTLILSNDDPVTMTASAGFSGDGELRIQPAGADFNSSSGSSSSGLETSLFTFGEIKGGLVLGQAGKAATVEIDSALTLDNTLTVYAGDLDIDGALTINDAGAAEDAHELHLHARTSADQSAAIDASTLALYGIGDFTLDNASNDVDTLAGGSAENKLGSLTFVNSGALTIGAINPTGITATGEIDISTKTGDLIIAEAIATDSDSARWINGHH